MARLTVILLCGLLACDDDDISGTGQTCETVDDCYGDVETDELAGEPRCFTNVSEGYCSHSCTTDADCCAADKECDTQDFGEVHQVCAPFESFGGRWCFLSCEDADLQAAGYETSEDYCRDLAGDFGCRATGGGDPRRVCLPPG